MLNEGEVAVGCCPSGYHCDPASPYYCFTTPRLGALITGVSYDPNCNATTTTSTLGTYSARRLYLIQPYNETALPLDDDASSGLPTVGKIVVGIVVPLIVILVSLAAFWLISRKKRHKESTQAREIHVNADGGDAVIKAELCGSEGTALAGPYSVAFEKPELENTPANSGSHAKASEMDVDPLDKGLLELKGSNNGGEKPRSTILELASSATQARAALSSDQPRDRVGDEALSGGQSQARARPAQEPDEGTMELWQWSNPLHTGESEKAVSTGSSLERPRRKAVVGQADAAQSKVPSSPDTKGQSPALSLELTTTSPPATQRREEEPKDGEPATGPDSTSR
ncbi:uncharacterized protein NECHADRAFT_89247 [Fusarium vanettenii 77-13-4]|uniref:Uncharacterized protein n=1 Tax=Fusarium vanettenii (strain ATCC MYA-4622 / CBS 123669 / FGSC 9596 / NRRL 45880 / 77-13-4) TaxID=660122 RepID=C7ZQM0_FUSV7|nr:uncharacterized protein NECHADRAFT_89247 [Fusarium vanettenii 77-13-4]EEU33691.1 predicted protein [Fusarium vanettenii 77-13-4]